MSVIKAIAIEMLNIEIEKLSSYLIGKHQKAVSVAKQLFKLNMPIEQIAEISGLIVDELQQLKDTDNQTDRV